MGQTLSIPFKLFRTTTTFWRGMYHYLCGAGRRSQYNPSSSFLKINEKDSAEEAIFKQHARVHLYGLASAFYLYNKPHYRKGSYRDDLLDNLRNLAIPGTGIPLSWFVGSKVTALGLVLGVNPFVCFMASLHNWWQTGGSISEEYATRLLAPNDWFSYWRLNCNIVGLHSYLDKDRAQADYDMENKWTFIQEAEKRNVPVSPYLKMPALVLKHRNEEGGMGIFFYKNALDGGDWIIQEKISNSDWVSSVLPPNAPLSTFRVLTQSRSGLSDKEPEPSDVTALSCVFRAGRENAATDHDSILFDVNHSTGELNGGTTNMHWYKLGIFQWLRCPWRSEHSFTHHPDGNIPITGQKVQPDISKLMKLSEEAHHKMCPLVPFAGWDVVLCKEEPTICFLEVNLSCNFFRGSFDQKVYFEYLEDAISSLQAKRLLQDQK
eukprot:CAMPEP_0194249488 /NCGR_PEP_ID=MMETSP0158-20130606/20596_1 /TAXON_ID=33649 /ORGANISM="Thalassionema nitzschioides, Strain L26-B" /LENGTH=433 /DNA_ID=CAMNT_0038986015 /DNA_START=29 /DNA_END=1330 /DNA_ORIENTATION=+